MHSDPTRLEKFLRDRLADQRSARRRSGRRGMTLMEVMIVIAIILMLMGALTFGLGSMFKEAQGDTALLQITRISERVRIFQMKKKKVPNSLSEIYKNEPLPKDPWGNEFVLRSGGGKKGFDLISYGADGSEGGGDDIKLSDAE